MDPPQETRDCDAVTYLQRSSVLSDECGKERDVGLDLRGQGEERGGTGNAEGEGDGGDG